MVLLLGSTGYIGSAFAQLLERSGVAHRTLSRKEVDYTRFDPLLRFLRDQKPSFIINAAGYTGKPNVDACEMAKADTLQGNTLFPLTVAQACNVAQIPLGHISSGCIYAGGKILENGKWRVEKNLNQPKYRELADRSPGEIRGFVESDPPNFSFRDGPCSFYSGTKALAEEALAGFENLYIWRLRIPFDEVDNPRNFLSKIQNYPRVYDNLNSLSHRGDFARACLQLWQTRAPFGTYNVTNPGYMSTRQVVEKAGKILKLERKFSFWEDDEEFYRQAAKTPRSNCLLETAKLQSAGVKLKPVEEAVEDALRHWQTAVR